MKRFNFSIKLKFVLRWGFSFIYLFGFAQENHRISFQNSSCIPSGKNTPVPVLFNDSSVFVSYKTKFKRSSKGNFAYAEFQWPSLTLLRENLIIPSYSKFQDEPRISPYKKFYHSSGIWEIGSSYDARKTEKTFFLRKINWNNFDASEWKLIWSNKEKRNKNTFPNFRFSCDSAALIGLFEWIKTDGKPQLQLLRIDLHSCEIISNLLPLQFNLYDFSIEGFSDFENGEIALIGKNSDHWNLGKKFIILFKPTSNSIQSYVIPDLPLESEMKFVKTSHGLVVWCMQYSSGNTAFHSIKQVIFDAELDTLYIAKSIELNNELKNQLQKSAQKINGMRSFGHSFKLFHYLPQTNEEWLVIQATQQFEKCNPSARGIPNCNMVYVYGDVFVLAIPKDSSMVKWKSIPRVREYEVPLFQGDSGFPFIDKKGLHLFFGDEQSKYPGKRKKEPSTVVYTSNDLGICQKAVVFFNKKENLYLDETTGIKAGENTLIFGGLKNKKSTIIKINLE